eukprot:scaffold34121_cov12-Tisochrysis_lutea.AAC.1
MQAVNRSFIDSPRGVFTLSRASIVLVSGSMILYQKTEELLNLETLYTKSTCRVARTWALLQLITPSLPLPNLTICASAMHHSAPGFGMT